jgi:hypothetical protein
MTNIGLLLTMRKGILLLVKAKNDIRPGTIPLSWRQSEIETFTKVGLREN